MRSKRWKPLASNLGRSTVREGNARNHTERPTVNALQPRMTWLAALRRIEASLSSAPAAEPYLFHAWTVFD